MDNIWPLLILSGVCCILPAGTFTMGLLVGKRGSPLHIKFAWKEKKTKQLRSESESFRWEEAG